MHGTRKDNFSIEKLSTGWTISIPNLLDYLKPVVWGKHEFEYREKKVQTFYLESSDFHESDASGKVIRFSVENSSTRD